jgi:hypothetical protein
MGERRVDMGETAQNLGAIFMGLCIIFACPILLGFIIGLGIWYGFVFLCEVLKAVLEG